MTTQTLSEEEIMRAMQNVLIDARHAALTAAIQVVRSTDDIGEAIRMLEELRKMTTNRRREVNGPHR